ncbi:hypothetical protein ACFOG5_19175 [Pedobacter fastidiosus]|uniref:hypothetical protein n=1 Tax=Pedobacter fastidiosus TaxID=2765361 RepID=UPI00164DCE73|nr:hypothetical protein [Pedobacter fastidiosus]
MALIITFGVASSIAYAYSVLKWPDIPILDYLRDKADKRIEKALKEVALETNSCGSSDQTSLDNAGTTKHNVKIVIQNSFTSLFIPNYIDALSRNHSFPNIHKFLYWFISYLSSYLHFFFNFASIGVP